MATFSACDTSKATSQIHVPTDPVPFLRMLKMKETCSVLCEALPLNTPQNMNGMYLLHLGNDCLS